MYIYIYTYICIYICIYIIYLLARQAAVPPPRNCRDILSIIWRNTTEHLAEKRSKSSLNRLKNGAESMKNILGTMAAPKRFLGGGGRPQAPASTAEIQGFYFGLQNLKKDVKNAINESY